MADVFISYTHIDNGKLSLSREQLGWIDLFHEALQLRLRMIWKRDADVWRDPKMGGNDVLDPTIEAAVRNSSVLLTVLSPDYLKSTYCTRELQIFCETAASSGGLVVGNKARIIKIVKTPVDDEPDVKPPAELEKLIGYRFYNLNERGHPFEIDPRHSEAEYADFMRAVNDVAHDVRDLLRALSGRAAPPPGRPRSTVYLAETSFDMTDVRDAVRRELEQGGHAVLPDVTLPLTPEYEDHVRLQLARADVSVHLIGANKGIVPDGSDRSNVELQYALAREERERRPDFETLAWLRPGVTPANPAQAAFVQTLQDGAQLLNVPFDDLRVEIGAMLERRAASDPDTKRIAIYVAETSFDIAADHAALRSRLEELGHVVLPAAPLPYSPDYVRHAAEELQKARMSVHLIGNGYGLIPDGCERSVCELQYDVAGAEASRRDFTRLVWFKPGAQPAGAPQTAFWAKLRREAGPLTGELDDIVRAVEKAARPRPESAAHAVAASASRPGVFVLYDVIDAEAVQPVRAFLGTQGFDLSLPLFEGDERRLREDLEENLRLCDAVLVYHGRTTPFWLRTKLRDLRRAFGLGRRRPYAGVAVLFADPHRTDKDEPIGRADVMALDGYGPFRDASLGPFLAALRRPDHEAV